VILHVLFQYRDRQVAQVDVFGPAAIGAFGDQFASLVVVVDGGRRWRGLLHALAEGVDHVGDLADGGVGRHHPSARVVIERGAAVVGGAAVGVGGNAGVLAAGELRHAVAGGAVAVVGGGGAVHVLRAVAHGVVAVAQAALRALLAGEAIEFVVAISAVVAGVAAIGDAGDPAGCVVGQGLHLAIERVARHAAVQVIVAGIGLAVAEDQRLQRAEGLVGDLADQQRRRAVLAGADFLDAAHLVAHVVDGAPARVGEAGQAAVLVVAVAGRVSLAADGAHFADDAAVLVVAVLDAAADLRFLGNRMPHIFLYRFAHSLRAILVHYFDFSE